VQTRINPDGEERPGSFPGQAIMTQANDVRRFLEQIAPLNLAEPWDNVGLLLGRSNRDVRRVMTCLTLTAPVAAEALRRDVQMIVTHHPILFRGTKQLSDATPEGRMLLDLAEAGVVVYSPHTAYDSSAAGINQALAESLGLTEIRPLRPVTCESPTGAGRMGSYPVPLPRLRFLKKVSDVVGANYLENCWNGLHDVRCVAIACGSAAELLDDAVGLGCEVFVTGEARFHSVLDSQARGISLVLTGHYASERPGIVRLASLLAREFKDLHVLASAADQNPLELFVPENTA
jgi:dinuclear metal center YbgI/SA1388 family protein